MLNIYGTLFKDTLVSEIGGFNNTKVCNAQINNTYGGVYNIIKNNITSKNDKIVILTDSDNLLKNYTNIVSYNTIPNAVIIENKKKKNRLSYVQKGMLNEKKKSINIKKKETLLIYYVENFPFRINRNDGIVISDFNNSGFIADRDVMINNINKSNYLLSNIKDSKRILNKIRRLSLSNKTIIFHSPKTYKILQNDIQFELKNKYFINNFSNLTGMGDIFAYYFAKNLKIKNINKTIEVTSSKINSWLCSQNLT